MEYFTEIAKLSRLLAEHGILHRIDGLLGGYQIIPVDGDWDVVCHRYSYGSHADLLEGAGEPFESDMDDVTGFLTAEQALALILA